MSYEVDLKRQGLNALIELQGDRERLLEWLGDGLPGLPVDANRATTRGRISAYRVARRKWLLRAPIGLEPELLAATRPESAPDDLGAVLLSDSLCFFTVDGADADQVISVVTPLDIHADAFPGNGAGFTEAFGLRALLIRRETGFELAVESSYGDMVEEYLAHVSGRQVDRADPS